MMTYDFDWAFLAKPQFRDMVLDGIASTAALAVLSGLLSFLLGSQIGRAHV